MGGGAIQGVGSRKLGSQRPLVREDYLGAFLFARFDPLIGSMSGEDPRSNKSREIPCGIGVPSLGLSLSGRDPGRLPSGPTNLGTAARIACIAANEKTADHFHLPSLAEVDSGRLMPSIHPLLDERLSSAVLSRLHWDQQLVG